VDENVMDNLFQIFLHRHVTSMPPEEKVKISKFKNKKADKIPKGHVVTKSKKRKNESWIYMCVFIQKILIHLTL